jgi:hypothetical protein
MGSTRKGRSIDVALRSKGFWRDATGDHLYYFFGDTRIKTKMSHDTMGDSLSVHLEHIPNWSGRFVGENVVPSPSGRGLG